MLNNTRRGTLAGPTGRDDNHAYATDLESFAPQVHRFVAQRVANPADAEDIAQQALLLACEKLCTFRGENFRGWLFTIARNLIVDHYRTQHRFKFVEVEDAAAKEAEPKLHTRAEAIHQVCDCREKIHSWVDCISRELRLEEQVAILLADVHGYDDREAAVLVAISRPSFKLLLHHARARLRQISGGACTLLQEAGVAGGGQPARSATGGEEAEARLECEREGCEPGGDRSSVGCGGCAIKTSSGANASGSECRARACGAGSSTQGWCRLGVEDRRSRSCFLGVNCRLGVRCCRNVPKLQALRGRLLECLTLS